MFKAFRATIKEINRGHELKIKSGAIVRKKTDRKWIVRIVLWAFALSVSLSFFASSALKAVNLSVAFLILFLFILIGILFDILGIAVTSAQEKPFHAMASRQVTAADWAVLLIRNTEKVSNFCNDVVGDISGIVSGSTVGSIIAVMGSGEDPVFLTVFSLFLTGAVSALTIGGKAYGKSVAINNSNTIVYIAALVIEVFLRPFRRKTKNR